MYNLSDFTRTPRKIPYLGYAEAEDHYLFLPPGSFARVKVGEPFDREAFHAANLLPVAYFGLSEEDWADDAAFQARLLNGKAWLDSKGLTPVAVEIEEEQAWRVVAGDMAGWPAFYGLDSYQKIDAVGARLGQLYGLAKQRFPGAYTLSVQPSWYHGREFGAGFGAYNPPYANVDVLGISHYMGAGGLGFTPAPTQTMLDRFHLDVGRRVEAAAAYGRPLLLCAQAFSDALWPKLHPDQLDWYYILAQRVPSVAALMFFCVEDRPAATVVGYLSYPDLAGMVGSIATYNAALE